MADYPTKHTCPVLARCGDEEPIFVLRAHDSLAEEAILCWINDARTYGVPQAKIDGVIAILEAMKEWQNTHPPKLPD